MFIVFDFIFFSFFFEAPFEITLHYLAVQTHMQPGFQGFDSFEFREFRFFCLLSTFVIHSLDKEASYFLLSTQSMSASTKSTTLELKLTGT
jgi:hypothetical protein